MSIRDRIVRIAPKGKTRHEQEIMASVRRYRCRVCDNTLPMLPYFEKGRCQCGNAAWELVEDK